MNGPHESCNKLSSRVGQVSLESSRLDPGRDDVCAHINMIYTYTIYIYHICLHLISRMDAAQLPIERISGAPSSSQTPPPWYHHQVPPERTFRV